MGDSYEKVKESEHVEAIRERARIIVEEEKRFPKSHRYHRFMHFVEAAESAGKIQEMAWEGVTRRVAQIMRVEVDRLEQKQQNLDGKLEQNQQKLDGKLVELQGEMNSRFELLERNMERNLETILDKLK